MINTYLQYIQEIYKPNEITLGKFDKEYWDSLPNDKDYMFYNPKRGEYYTLLLNKKIKVGITGVILNPKKTEFGFFQIYIDKQYRGKGLLKLAAKLIFKKYKLKSLIATIKKNNKASVNSHIKAGFIEVDKVEQADLIERGYQKKDEVRYIYRRN